MKNLLLLAAITLSSLTSATYAQDSSALLVTQEISTAVKQLPIINFNKVNDELYRGARLQSAEGYQYLKSLGIKTIINLQGGDLHSKLGKIIGKIEPGERPEIIEKEKETAFNIGMNFINTPLNSLQEVTHEEDVAIDETLDFMNDPTYQPVYIHCEHGADRTGLLVALYRVKYEGMSVQDAHKEWIKNGHNILHRAFTGDLDEYFYKKVKEFNK